MNIKNTIDNIKVSAYWNNCDQLLVATTERWIEIHRDQLATGGQAELLDSLFRAVEEALFGKVGTVDQFIATTWLADEATALAVAVKWQRIKSRAAKRVEYYLEEGE